MTEFGQGPELDDFDFEEFEVNGDEEYSAESGDEYGPDDYDTDDYAEPHGQ